MSIIETIRAEIKRRNLANYCGTAEQYEEELFAILDTLPEQPGEELEIEISLYWNRVTGCQPSFSVLELTKDDLAKVARHFADWGASHAKTPTP